MRAFELTRGIARDILSREARSWTRGDWLAALCLVGQDALNVAAYLVLDCTGALGRTIEYEVLLRRALAQARAIDADVFCVYHDCDTKNCEGEHDGFNDVGAEEIE